MEPDLVSFNNGVNPNGYSEVVSNEVTVLFNPMTKNYVFFLSTEEYGPVIVEQDFERGKEKFKTAFGGMLIFRSIMSIPEAREKVSGHIRSAHNEWHSDINLPKRIVSPSEMTKIAEKAKKKMENMIVEMDTNVVIR